MINNSSKYGSGALIVASDTGRALLNLRAAHKSHSLCWAVWGGMNESGETPATTLVRELREELGRSVHVERFYPFDVFESQDQHFKYYTYVAMVSSEFTPSINHESAGYAWVSVGQWPRPMHRGTASSFGSVKSVKRLKSLIHGHLSNHRQPANQSSGQS